MTTLLLVTFAYLSNKLSQFQSVFWLSSWWEFIHSVALAILGVLEDLLKAQKPMESNVSALFLSASTTRFFCIETLRAFWWGWFHWGINQSAFSIPERQPQDKSSSQSRKLHSWMQHWFHNSSAFLFCVVVYQIISNTPITRSRSRLMAPFIFRFLTISSVLQAFGFVQTTTALTDHNRQSCASLRCISFEQNSKGVGKWQTFNLRKS